MGVEHFRSVSSNLSEAGDGKEFWALSKMGRMVRDLGILHWLLPIGNTVDAEWIEQYEPGVYITLVALRDGTRDLKRVRFSRRRFGEHQAEIWWSDNREKVYEKYRRPWVRQVFSFWLSRT
ncbi:hypothetical protein M0R45_001047 [Rubus argutus]|uniref:BRX domain-containing protein n=1 Tax=Rubus argutus TaxID=59490 RepID=A0AAW1VMQ1_RUBAR